MSGNTRLFGTNGIRGVVNRELTVEFLARIGSAVGTFFKGGNIAVGFDGRVSSPMFAKVLDAGLASTGCTVYDAGMIPTPALQFVVKQREMDGGIMVTASHNPPEYNGVKVIGGDGIEVERKSEVRIEKLFFKEETRRAEWYNIRAPRPLSGVLEEYKTAIKAHINVGKISKRRLRLVVDPGNGVGGLVAPYLFRELNCSVVTLNSDVDGTFPGRPSEPTPKNLAKLAATVRAVDADLGVAYDGDADRSIFVDERGEIYPGDRTFALILKFFLPEDRRKVVVTPVSSSNLIEEITSQQGGRVVWTKVGSVTVSHAMKKEEAALGGEENGGVFYGPHQPVRDGAMTTALILDVMSKSRERLSKLLGELPHYFIEKDRVPCPNTFKARALQEFIRQLEECDVNTIDGVKMRFPDKSSILIRPSGTEPIFRLYAEAKKRDIVHSIIRKYKGSLQRIIREMQS